MSKTQPTKVSVADFLKSKASATQLADCKTIVKLFRELTGKAPKMWGPSIVGFDSYHYVYESGREGDAPLIGLSPRGKEIVMYVNTSPSKALLAKLGKHRAGAGCLYIKSLADVDEAILRKLAQASMDDIRKRYPAK